VRAELRKPRIRVDYFAALKDIDQVDYDGIPPDSGPRNFIPETVARSWRCFEEASKKLFHRYEVDGGINDETPGYARKTARMFLSRELRV